MENNDALTAGVSPDGLKSKAQIKVLICWLLESFGGLLARDEMIGIICGRRLANYFEVCDAIERLITCGNISIDNTAHTLSNCSGGAMASAEFGSKLPKTVREKAFAAATKYIARRRSESENRVSITDDPAGCRVRCDILEGERELMSVSMFVPDRTYANVVRERFFNDPEYLYRMVLSYLTDEKELAPDDANNQGATTEI